MPAVENLQHFLPESSALSALLTIQKDRLHSPGAEIQSLASTEVGSERGILS